MAYGAVTRNLVKRVAELEARVEALEAERALWRRPIESMISIMVEESRGVISQSEALDEIRDVLRNSPPLS